jgi:hypothetical protein
LEGHPVSAARSRRICSLRAVSRNEIQQRIYQRHIDLIEKKKLNENGSKGLYNAIATIAKFTMSN